MIGLDLFSLTVTTIAPGVLSGMIANPGDRAFCRIMGDIVGRMKDGGPPVNHDLQRAVRRSYLRAIRRVGLRALAEEREQRGWLGRTVGHALFPPETVRALSEIEKKLRRKIRDVDTAPYVPPPPVEADQISLLLQPRDASARERLTALRDQSNEKILRLLEEWVISVPERFAALVRDGWAEGGRRVDGFDLMCGFFQEELKTNEKVRSIFQSKLLANLDIGLDQIIGGLEELGRKLDAMHGDIRDAGEGVRRLERDVRFVRDRLEDGDPASVRDAEPVEYLPLPESRDALPPVQPLPPNHSMPYPSRFGLFVGRVAEIWALHDTLQNRGAAIVDGASGGGEPVGMIAGAGGLGKTQLAAEYVHRFGFLYPGGVFWIPAERGLSELAAILARHGAAPAELDPRMEIPEQLGAIWRELERRGRETLIVLDNFPETEPLGPWLPPGGMARVAVTTRRRDLTRYAKIRLDFMTPEEGARLINMNRNLGPDAERISEALGGLPLALELARNYLEVRPGTSVDQLLANMAKIGEMAALRSFEGKYADQMPSGHVKEVAATIAMSWDLASEPARRVLRALALLAPVPVPMRLVRRVFPDWESEDLLEDPVEEAAAELAVKLSLANFDEDADPVVHRLVAGFAREVEEADPDLADRVARAVADEMERAGDNMDTAALRELEKMVFHAEHLLDATDIGDERAAEISNWLLHHYRNAGQYRNAERAGRRSLEWAERLHEPGHPKIASRQSNLATVLHDLGESAPARELFEKALHAFEEILPPGHPDIARSQSNIALVLKDLGELAPARELYEKALESDEASFPPGHPEIARSQSNLALVLKDLGELAPARELFEKALHSLEENLPPGHPNIATFQSNLALVLKDLGELATARELYEKALESDEASFPPGHPSIAIRQSNLATVLKALGELAPARELLEKALKSAEVSFPPGHPDIAIRQNNLALVLKDLGELAPARELYEKALESDEANFPPGHPSIAICQSNLAGVLRDLGELAPARELLEKALHSLEESLPPGHPNIATLQSNLAVVLRDLGELAPALELAQQAYISLKEKLGPAHPKTQASEKLLKKLQEKIEKG